MAFIETGTTLTLVANLTTIGRQKLLMNSSNLITHFALGDSDANYNAEYPLSAGTIPVLAGHLSNVTGATNSLDNNFQLRSRLIRGINTKDGIVPTSQNTKKPVEKSSGNVTVTRKWLGYKTISGSSLYTAIINRNETDGDNSRLTNLFKTFGLPITMADKTYFTTVPYPNGFSDTALSGLNQDKVLVIGIPADEYGELIDGKSIKLEFSVSGGTTTAYTIYSTYQSTLTNLQTQDNNIYETSSELKFRSNLTNPQLVGFNKFGNNVAFLFSDEIAKPNHDTSKSWSTGYGTFKPFYLNGKEQFNLVTNSNLSKTADTAVGIAYLDKGFIVITHPNIVNYFDQSLFTAATLTFDSVTTEVSQKITCIVERGEFGYSTNPTFSAENHDIPRISEVALLDASGLIIAVAKFDRQIELSNDMFLALGIQIVV